MSNNEFSIQERVHAGDQEEIKSPRLYKVFLLNDDYTTMDFVVQVLEKIFRKPIMEATQIMLHVHRQGKGLAGVYSREIAETKITAVEDLSRQQGFPLRCAMERE